MCGVGSICHHDRPALKAKFCSCPRSSQTWVWCLIWLKSCNANQKMQKIETVKVTQKAGSPHHTRCWTQIQWRWLFKCHLPWICVQCRSRLSWSTVRHGSTDSWSEKSTTFAWLSFDHLSSLIIICSMVFLLSEGIALAYLFHRMPVPFVLPSNRKQKPSR